MSKRDGGSVFPEPYTEPNGMSMRQWYKGMALPLLKEWSGDKGPEWFAKAAGAIADALVAEDEEAAGDKG